MPLIKTLVVDHDPKSIHFLRQVLNSAGFEVIGVNKPDRALQLTIDEHPVLIITEIDLHAEIDGIQFIHQVREISDIPLIILSAHSDTEEVLRGFEAGADDFISKPFDSRILVARIKAVLNRVRNTQTSPEMIQCGPITINQISRQVTLNEVPVYLTETEYNLLLELAKHPDQVMLHRQLLESVWGPEYSYEMDYLRSYIHILRKKLEGIPSQPSLIISLSGIGYKLVSSPAGNQSKK